MSVELSDSKVSTYYFKTTSNYIIKKLNNLIAVKYIENKFG